MTTPTPTSSPLPDGGVSPAATRPSCSAWRTPCSAPCPGARFGRGVAAGLRRGGVASAGGRIGRLGARGGAGRRALGPLRRMPRSPSLSRIVPASPRSRPMGPAPAAAQAARRPPRSNRLSAGAPAGVPASGGPGVPSGYAAAAALGRNRCGRIRFALLFPERRSLVRPSDDFLACASPARPSGALPDRAATGRRPGPTTCPGRKACTGLLEDVPGSVTRSLLVTLESPAARGRRGSRRICRVPERFRPGPFLLPGRRIPPSPIRAWAVPPWASPSAPSRRPRGAARLPHPAGARQRPATGLVRQRRHDAEAAVGDRPHLPFLRARELQHPPRRPRAGGPRHRRLRRRPRRWRRFLGRQRRGGDHLRARRHRGHQPGGQDLGPPGHWARATRSSSPTWSTTPTSCPGSSSRQTKKAKIARDPGGRRRPGAASTSTPSLLSAAHQDRRGHPGLQRAGHGGAGPGDRGHGASRTAPRRWWTARSRCPTCAWTCRPWTPTSSSSPATRSSGPPASAWSTASRPCSTPCRPGRAAAT